MTENIARISKYNFWDGKMHDLGILRTVYLDRIKEFLGNKLVKVITGQRRAGKSYILRQTISRLLDDGINPHNVLYINKEFTEFDFIQTWSDLETLANDYVTGMQITGKAYLFIDEVQDIDGWERFVSSCSQSYFHDFEVLITGSNSQLLSGELASLLSGRYVQIQVQPFNYQEFLAAKQLKGSKSSYLEFLSTGGLPELFHLPNEETKRHYVSALKDTVLLRDIVQRYNIKNAKLLEDLFVYLVNNASNLISVPNIVDYFAGRKRKVHYETVANYIQYMEYTFLVHKVERYSIKGKETLSGTCKYYINDLSFKNYLYPGFEYGLGYKLENAVFLNLNYAGYSVYVGSLRNREVDFVARKGSRTLYIQSTWVLTDVATIDREYNALKAIDDNYEKIVVSMDDIQLESNEGIAHVQAWKLDEVL